MRVDKVCHVGRVFRPTISTLGTTKVRGASVQITHEERPMACHVKGEKYNGAGVAVSAKVCVCVSLRYLTTSASLTSKGMLKNRI